MHICGSFDVYIKDEDDECSPDCINKREVDNYYTREEVNALLAQKQDVLTKQDIIDLLGYKETLLSMETCDGTVSYHSVLAKEIPVVKTVLFTDGTLIINELASDRAADTALHGVVTNIYPPLDESHDYNFNNYTDVYWYSERLAITSVKFGSPVQPTKTANWFANHSNLVSVDTQNLDTSNVNSMGFMFYKCVSLTTIDVSQWDTSNVTGFGSMFEQCEVLSQLDVSNWDTGKVTTLNYMFYKCQTLTALDVSNWDTKNVTNMGSVFYKCINLASIDVSNWNTQNVNRMGDMFRECQEVTSLDLSNWDTSGVTIMYNMFNKCNKLKTIYASDKFVVAQVTESYSMFNQCYVLKGGNGTTYTSSHQDKEYARIDAPGTPGYFTEA